MKHLEYNTQIAASKQKVWNTMLQPETYKQWVNVSWPGSIYIGKWEKGEQLKFTSPEQQGGTVAKITELVPFETLTAKHVAVINPDGSEDRTSEVAKGWVGTLERYTFNEQNGKTNLKVEIEIITPEWESMFNDGWPAALKELKRICEK